MKYVAQLSVILLFTFLGELLHACIPLPIPAAIYGLVLLLIALLTGLVKLEQVKQTGDFLIGIMGVLFVAPAVNLLESWIAIENALIPICVIIVLSSLAVFFVSGKVTQFFCRKSRKNAEEHTPEKQEEAL